MSSHNPFFTHQALVDAPDMVRSQMNFKRLSLTDIKIDIKRVPKKKALIAAMEAAGEYLKPWKPQKSYCVHTKEVNIEHLLLLADVKGKWENSSWGRKLIVQKRRAALNDFDRFKLMLAKIKVLVLFFLMFIYPFKVG